MGVHLVDEAAEGNHCKAAVLDLGELVSLQVGLVLSLAPDAVSAKPAQSYVGLLSMRRRFVLAVSFSIMYRGRPDINDKINKCGCSHGKSGMMTQHRQRTWDRPSGSNLKSPGARLPWMVWKRAIPPKISANEVQRRIWDMPPDLTSASCASMGDTYHPTWSDPVFAEWKIRSRITLSKKGKV